MKPRCPFQLHGECVVYPYVKDNGELVFLNKEWVSMYCGMCVKTAYAKSRLRFLKHLSVVNTL